MNDDASHPCNDCVLVFDSSESLDSHLRYHTDHLLNKWAEEISEIESNSKKNHRVTTPDLHRHSTPDLTSEPSNSIDMMSSDSYYPQNHTPGCSYLLQSSQEEASYVLGGGTGFPQSARTPTPNSCSSLSPHHQSSSNHRYHPYQRYSGAIPSQHHRRTDHSSCHQCEKCGFMCETEPALIEHISVTHPLTPSPELFNNNDLNTKQDTSPSQAEILDLDSHKVHVYQPPQQPREHSVSALMTWVNNISDNPNNGNSHPSPDCYGNVSTTTVTPPLPDLLPPHQQTYQFGHSSPLAIGNPQQISSTQLPIAVNQGSQKKLLKRGNGTWKLNEARRPKTYNCSACNKWFTSSGHLKRHYNTTLHKNAVKQSGAPDPATMPISVHHHPHKDPNYLPPRSPVVEPPGDPPTPQSPHVQQTQQSHILNNNFLQSPPNLMAGPSELSGGLLLHTTPYQEITTPTHPTTNFLPFQSTHHTFLAPQHPNFQPPHVSTSPQVTISNISGNSNMLDAQNYLLEPGNRNLQSDQLPLPGFAQLQQNYAPYFSAVHSVVSNSDFNVGGLSPDQNLSNLDSIYSIPTSIESSYSFGNIDSSITVPKPFESPSSTNNNGAVDTLNNNNIVVIKDESSSTSSASSMISQTITNDEKNFPDIKLLNLDSEDNSVSSTMEHSPSLLPLVTTPPPPPIIKCVDCDKVFNKACYLTQHNKSFHSGEKPFKCDQCGKRFIAEYLHQEHIIKHAGEKPYKCEICPKQFNHKTDLRRHMCLHTGDKPYACNHCGKGFIRKDHMVKHSETHKRRQPGPRQQKHNSFVIGSFKQHSPQNNSIVSTIVMSSSATPSHKQPAQTLQLVM